jgi:hypothetical protein
MRASSRQIVTDIANGDIPKARVRVAVHVVDARERIFATSLRNGPELPEEAESVLLTPLFGDSAFVYFHDREPAPSNDSACRGQTQQITAVLTAGIPTEDRRIAVGCHVPQVETQVRQAGPNDLKDLLE